VVAHTLTVAIEYARKARLARRPPRGLFWCFYAMSLATMVAFIALERWL